MVTTPGIHPSTFEFTVSGVSRTLLVVMIMGNDEQTLLTSLTTHSAESLH